MEAKVTCEVVKECINQILISEKRERWEKVLYFVSPNPYYPMCKPNGQNTPTNG